MATATTEPSSLARYVPRLSAEWETHSSERWQEIDGTLCYIDISGFTALSEKLARRGRIGAEELTEVLNYVFGKMLAVAYDRGGSLLKFGGDALLLLFRGTDHPVQACSAAVEMQAALREASNYQTSAGRLRLRMSVGLHSGAVHLFRVGGSHKELILTGPAASETTEMEETAAAGEILISTATKSALPSGSVSKQKGDGWLLNWRKPRLECCGWSQRTALEPDAIAAGMPLALRDFLQYGAAEPEHRLATVGFIKYEGVDALMDEGGADTVAVALDELVRNVQEAVDNEGVTFLASDIDQDGGKIILVAGVPGAQEDDEGRLLRAARRIADGAGTLPVRIGVNRGHVFVGEIGTDFRATYTIMGDTVNLAARLMAAAPPGEVYASPGALDRSLTLFDTSALEPFNVKGKEHPVQAYAVGTATGSRPRDHKADFPFVGRVEEKARLQTLVADLMAGKGSTVAIIGERGVGKSRLVDQILPALERADHIDIRAEPYGMGTPYRSLRDPVQRLLGVKRGSRGRMARGLESGVAALGDDLLPMLPLLADVAMIEVPSTPEVDVIEPRFRPDRTADLVVEVLARSFDGPFFFEVEDGHYMDEASTHVMERIAAAVAEHPWFVLTTRRDTPDGFDPGAEEISLDPLSDGEARQLVISATEAAPLRPHDIDAIVRRAGGLPLFLEEIVRAVRRAGGVADLPDSLDAMVSSQIDALSPLARRLLRYASVLGRSFRVWVLEELLEEEDIVLDQAIRAEVEGFLDADGPDRLRFRHGMMRDVAYQGLSFKRRRELHLRAGLAAERAAGDDPEAAADVLALHFSIAQEHERTWRYAVIAGDQARDSYANVDAATFYQRALESARRLPEVLPVERAMVLASLGDVHERAGLFKEALDAYRRASGFVGADAVAKAELSERRARVRERSGDYQLALREVTSGLRTVAKDESPEGAGIRARLLAFSAAIRQAQQKPREAVKQALHAAEEARAAGERAALARAYSVLDVSYRFLGEPEKAVFAQDALAAYVELGDLAGQGVVNGNMGVEAYFDGRWDDAVESYRRSRDAFRRMGNEVHAAAAESNMGEVLVNQGRFREAIPLLQDALRVLQASDHVDGASFVEVQLARVHAAEGDIEEALQLFDKAHDQFIGLGETASVADLAVYVADCHVQRARPLDALEVLDRAEALAGREAAVHSPGMLRVRAAALAELGDVAGAIQAIEAGLAAAESQGLPYETGLLLLAQVDITRTTGGTIDERGLARATEILSGLGVETRPKATVTLP